MRFVLATALCLTLLTATPGVLEAHAQPPTAAVLSLDLPGTDSALVEALTAELRAAAYAVVKLDADALCDPAQLSVNAIDLLVLPNASRLPLRSIDPIHAYLRSGGDCIALNAPAWQEQLIRADGEWTTLEEYRLARAGEPPPHVVFDFGENSLNGWQRGAFRTEIETRFETVPDGPAPGQQALHVGIPTLDNWDTVGPNAIEQPFPDGHTLTVFSARGGPNTTDLAVEWVERDGSRWIAVVPLTQQWQQYVLAPEKFHFWESVPARSQSVFRPENAARMTFGLAFSHTGHSPGPHEYWVGPFGTAAMGPAYEGLLSTSKPPKLETLSPSYKFFDSNDVARLVTASGQVVVPDTQFAVPRKVRSPHPRPQAGGFDKGRAWRWMPLIEARTTDGAWRGTPATMLCHADGPCKGGVWAAFGVGDVDWYLTKEARRAVQQVASRMADALFIVDGGANFYTYFANQEIGLGVRVANVGKTRKTGLTARVIVTTVESGKTVHASSEWPLDIDAGQTVVVSESWTPTMWPERGFMVTAELRDGGRVIDCATHEAHVWRPKTEKQLVTVEDGDFMLDGTRWCPHGVNYMPSSGIGTEDQDYFEHWIGARAYDPKVIQRDLEHIKDLGLNAVSIFTYRRSMEAQNLLDLLRRLDELGLKANLSLRPGTPMDFPWPEMRELIEYYRLWEHDTVFALDLAWEPLFRNHEREPLNKAWEEWIVERYGSIENAEREWHYPVPRDGTGKVVNFQPNQLVEDGPWNRCMAAYRRFLDTVLYEKYSDARRLVKSLDPYHHVSFRMSTAGDPTVRWLDCIPYDFAYLAGAVDILEPEGYGRIGDWERVKPGWFTYEYGRWANPELPVMWAEAGVHAWDISGMESSPERLRYQAAFYERFCRMLIGSGADGIFWWWYPGGFRANEKSDYGIINPDGSDRPVSKVIREHADRLIRGPSARPVDTWLEMDRDNHASGLNGIYDEAQETFWKAIDDGRVPGLKTAGTGTDSATCPLVAVGNTPCTGSNPPKYLDGWFDVVAVQGADGEWVEVAKGGRVKVNGTDPVVARVTLTNLGEAKWIAQDDAPDGVGAVRVVAEGSGSVFTPLPVAVARFEETETEVHLTREDVAEPVDVTLTLEAAGRTRFGPKFTVTLLP